mgnify:CR=1 FL=1
MLSACGHAKNILRIYEANICQKGKRILRLKRKHTILIKKKRVVGATGTSSEPNSSPVSRDTCLAYFSYFTQQKNCFKKYFTNLIIILRNEGVVTFHFLQNNFLTSYAL